MSAKIIIGYRTRPVSNVEAFMPEFKAPSDCKDAAKIAADVEEKKQAFLAGAKDCPYTGTFDQVFLVDKSHEKLLQWDYHESEQDKPLVSVRVRNYLLKAYPDGWSERDYDARNPVVRFIGFDIRRFLKILGLELSLPNIDKQLPLKMWYSNSEHRDIEEAVLPHDFEKKLTLDLVLQARRPTGNAKACAAWDANLKDWKGPHVNPEKDARLTVELANQLGFLTE